MKVAIYARVSTKKQDTELQIKELTAYAAARAWTVCKLYEDVGTGTNTNRPQFQEMMKDARAKRFDAVLVWKLDRFGRSLRDLVTHMHELTELKVTFISLRDSIDLSTAMGRFATQMLAAFAEFEAAIIKERVTAGVHAKIAKTGRWGRRPTVNVAKVRALRAEGASYRVIASKLKISIAAVSRALAHKE